MACFLCYSIHGDPLCGGWFVDATILPLRGVSFSLFLVTYVLYLNKVFHNLLIVIHGHPSLNERYQAVEDLLMGALKLANALFELRVAERGLGFLTLGDEKLLVAERIVDIKQFFRAHKKHLRR